MKGGVAYSKKPRLNYTYKEWIQKLKDDGLTK